MDWKLYYAPNAVYKDCDFATEEQLRQAGFDCIPATVPGNFELDLMAAGKEEDLFYSANTLHARHWEVYHVWYVTEFDADPNAYLHFDGIDTVAEIWLNGEFVATNENMFTALDVDAPLLAKGNRLVVHILPAVLEARKYPLPASCYHTTYGLESLAIRKAPHVYGWDIMPRIVSCGIWKPVTLRCRKPDAIDEQFIFSRGVVPDQKDLTFGRVEYMLDACLTLSRDEIAGYSWRLTLQDGLDSFTFGEAVYHNHISFAAVIDRARLWWPKPVGEAHLYTATLQLLYDGQTVDEKTQKVGFRTVELERTEDCSGPEGGEFVFRVNGKKVFICGTNWVPLDAFHSRDEERLPMAVALLEETGCNMIRGWGGNVYGSDSLYDWCDEHGVLVWQDFAMACGVYPMEEYFYDLLREEVKQVAKRLRNHPSLALWAGDNECDMSYVYWRGLLREPANYAVTRKIIPEVLELHDFTRPYLPSSPYVSRRNVINNVFTQGTLPEDHLWGPRDYFKGKYYTTAAAHFASETGYHGCPSPESLKKYIAPGLLWPMLDETGYGNRDWLTHATCVEPEPGKTYSYRITLMVDQVKNLFADQPEDLDTFARMSQISQAEAKKFFIERFRIDKWNKTGIIWWNLLDGWPQISDAVVDYYGVKKLAFSYICRSQKPVCLILSEPDTAGNYTLFGVNDLPREMELTYTVQDVTTGQLLHSGSAVLPADSSTPLTVLTASAHRMLQFTWQAAEQQHSGINHYYTDLLHIRYADYLRDLSAMGWDCFEGFNASESF